MHYQYFISFHNYMKRSLIFPKGKPGKEIISNEERSKRYVEGLEEKLFTEFELGKIQVSVRKKPYLTEKEKEAKEDRIYRKILQQKKKTQIKLQELELNQKQHALKFGPKTQKVERISRVRSKLSQQEVIDIKRIQRQQKEHEKSLQQKIKKIQQNEQKKKNEEREEKQRLIKEKNEKKKHQIQKRLDLIQKNGKMRQKKISEEKQLIERLKSKKKLFEMLDETWKQKNEQEEQKKWEIMEKRLKNQEVDLTTLREHEKKYQTVLTEKRRELYKKRRQIMKLHNENDPNIELSRFYNSVAVESQKMKEIEEEKKQFKRQYRNKIEQYGIKVKNQHPPKVRVNSENTENSESKIPEVTNEQRYEKGIQNLRYGKSKRKKDSKTIDSTSVQQTRTNPRFKDYLTETRKEREKSDNVSQFYKTPLREAEKIMKNTGIQRKQRVAKIKILADKIDHSTLDVVKKVANKLQILELIN